MKIPSTLITAMLLSATIGISAGCKTRKTDTDKEKVQYEKPQKHSPHDCPGCGMG